MMINRYKNRTDAGLKLATELQAYANRENTIVFALPRGGVPVAYEIAKKLHLPLDVFIVRKLGMPGHTELAMGALASGGVIVFNDDVLRSYQISEEEIKAVIEKEERELARRVKAYRDDLPSPDVKNKTVILVDDGIATGATMRAAVAALQQLGTAQILIAVPVAQKDLVQEFAHLVSEVICPLQPDNLYAVGAWYEDFSQTEDEEVSQLLSSARQFSRENSL